MAAALSLEQHGRVLVATMDDGRANAISTEMSTALRDAVRQAEDDDGIAAMVIAGRPGRFSGGFDLGVIKSGDVAAVMEMVKSGGSLVRDAFGASIPVVAACTGHAVAAGALILLGCDHRVGSHAESKIGLNEVAIGMVLPGWAMTIARERLSPRYLQEAVVNARLFSSSEAVAAGFLDTLVEPDAVVGAAIARAEQLATLDPAAYAGTVRAFRGSTLAAMAGFL